MVLKRGIQSVGWTVSWVVASRTTRNCHSVTGRITYGQPFPFPLTPYPYIHPPSFVHAPLHSSPDAFPCNLPTWYLHMCRQTTCLRVENPELTRGVFAGDTAVRENAAPASFLPEHASGNGIPDGTWGGYTEPIVAVISRWLLSLTKRSRLTA